MQGRLSRCMYERFLLPGLGWVIACICMVLTSSCVDTAESPDLPDHVDFNFHVRPILSNHCFLCHGPDVSSREADLRLDLEGPATAFREDGIRAIVPGNAKASEMIKRLLSDDPAYKMPPPSTNKVLSAREIGILRKWIDQGAEWKPYWAFVAPEELVLPEDHELHPIDYFIQQSKHEKGILSASPASAHSLIRRLSYLLRGLPPSIEDLEDFKDSDEGYHNLVDKYLASPQFGERWARHWMDLARYAEGKGHEFDYPIIGAWRYRDYLIRAFNEDVPYDRFIQEQLAGDLLDSVRYHPDLGTNESALGTAFLMMAEGKHSPVDIKEEEKIMIDNMIDVTSKTFLGLTVACARCHDHKFDDIPTTDYYALYGIFESMRHHIVPASTTLEQTVCSDSIDALKNAIKGLLVSNITDRDLGAKATQIAHHRTQDGPVPGHRMIGDFTGGSLDGWHSDGLAFGNRNQLGQPYLEDNGRLTFPHRGFVSSRHYRPGLQGAFRSPTFTIDKRYLRVKAAGKHSMIRVIVDNFQLIQAPIYDSLDVMVNSKLPIEYELDLRMVMGHKAYVEVLAGRYTKVKGKYHHYGIPPDAWIEAYYAVLYDQYPATLSATHTGSTDTPSSVALDAWVAGRATPDQIHSILPLVKNAQPDQTISEDLQAEIRRLASTLYDSTFIIGAVDGDQVLSPVFVSGDHFQVSDDPVPHRFLTALDSSRTIFTRTASGRLELAEAISSPDNPLTSRVMVNRIWHHLFGQGLVKTVDNFGLQGSIPTHPALLDHLAVEFIREGWSVKSLIKYIVTSEVFRQSTLVDPHNHDIDPTNKYLHHFPVRRLEAETIRDAILATSGRLNLEMFGPSIPIYLTDFLNGRGKPPESGPLDGYGRRSIYQAIWRNFLPPMMLTFDMPIPFSTFGARSVTNVPAQSLTMLNDPLILDQAAIWSTEINDGAPTFEKKLDQVYLRAFSRKPTTTELEDARLFFDEQGDNYGITAADRLTDDKLWRDYCHAIFNMKEFIFLL